MSRDVLVELADGDNESAWTRQAAHEALGIMAGDVDRAHTEFMTHP